MLRNSMISEETLNTQEVLLDLMINKVENNKDFLSLAQEILDLESPLSVHNIKVTISLESQSTTLRWYNHVKNAYFTLIDIERLEFIMKRLPKLPN